MGDYRQYGLSLRLSLRGTVLLATTQLTGTGRVSLSSGPLAGAAGEERRN